ncbi:methylamine utilization protein [Pseudomonas sp. BMS12]|uniref:methylamine utilization protein n=1 Tax=Pseudomonas sp. BMS12 TaxID=1796033 RepID=UPI00083A6A6B|nr:methylamine utilization protein [Pseudomonas sp. BMS12]
MKLHRLALVLVLGGLGSVSAGAATLDIDLRDGQGQPLENAVFSLRGAGPAPAAAQGVMDQRNKQFLPRVLAVRTGTSVKFPNSDNIRHHVYSFSPAKRFELRLYQGTPSEPVLFDKPGLVVLGCNIHDWMLGYVYVTDDPWFAVSDERGHVRLELPAGTYQVSLWHPQVADMLPVAAGSLQVPEQGLARQYPLQLVGDAAQALPTQPAPSAFGEAIRKAASDVYP